MAAQMQASKIEGLEEEMIETLRILKESRASLQAVRECDKPGGTAPSRYKLVDGPANVYITRGELLRVMEARVTEFEAKARELGIFGPATKVEPGQGVLIAHSRGGTQPNAN